MLGLIPGTPGRAQDSDRSMAHPNAPGRDAITAFWHDTMPA